jgi:hypothetical protein
VTRPTVDELRIADAPESWEAVGFAIDRDLCRVGGVRIRLAGPDAGRGIVGWSVRDVATADLDGLPTAISEEPPDAPDEHPNGCVRIDHIVIFTPDLERTIGSLGDAGIGVRRVRDAGTAESPVRQGFFRLGEVILEADEHDGSRAKPDASATFWGLAFVVPDLDALAELLGDRIGSAREAVQPGWRIATLRRAAGLSVPVAFMTPEPARE